VTKEEIIRMAREAGLIRTGDGWTEPHRWGMAEIERFANLDNLHKFRSRNSGIGGKLLDKSLVAEAYRCGYKDGMEAGAVICENVDKSTHPADLATAIRNRGCWECGERWEFGSASTCKCKKLVKKREWVGLTDDEREAIANSTIRIHGQEWAYATAIEAKLKEKNT